MKRNLITGLKGAILIILFIVPVLCYGQKERAFITKYLKILPEVSDKKSKGLLNYRMTAVYTNRDLYGNFTSKTKVTGDYTRGLPGDSVTWNNVYISGSQKFSESFPQGSKQEYMENIRYFPSTKILPEQAFKHFPITTYNFIKRLSSIYRYILENSSKDRVSLKAELSFIRDCFFLHRIRDDEKIMLDVKVNESTVIALLTLMQLHLCTVIPQAGSSLP